MGVISWVIVGLLAGGLARRATGQRKQGCLATIAIGIIGALLGGAIFRLATGDELGAFKKLNLASIFVAFVGSCALLLVLEAVGGDRRRRR
jgi:uncharacterized membrane protein YeaQ/YmgE (transglycosylase-associated protein family)